MQWNLVAKLLDQLNSSYMNSSANNSTEKNMPKLYSGLKILSVLNQLLVCKLFLSLFTIVVG